MQTEIIAYTATSISILGRLVFMYLLYSRKSTNIYSLVFCIMNIASSSLWIRYSQFVTDTPLIIRGSSDLALFVISASYISYNRYIQHKIEIQTVECNKQNDINSIVP